MPKEFYDWLNKCPIVWIKQTEDSDSVVYRFHNWEPNWNELKEEENA